MSRRHATALLLAGAALLLLPPPASARPDRQARSTINPSRKAPVALPARSSRSEATDPTALERLREEVQTLWAGRVLRRGTTAVLVVDAETGTELFNVHSDVALNPASNVKLISTATVLDILGPDWRYQTRVLGAVPDAQGVVRGGVYLLGNHDPTLPVSALPDMAAQLKGAGVTRIDGDVVLSEDIRRDTLAVNRLKITVASEAGSSQPTIAVSPASDFARVESSVSIRSRGRSRIRVKSEIVTDESGNKTLLVKLSGRLRSGHSRVVRPTVRLRSTFTAHALRAALIEAGIEVTGTIRLDEVEPFIAEVASRGALPVELASHASRPMGELVSVVNKRSLNHLADRLVMTAAAQKLGGEPTMEQGVVAMQSWLGSIGIPSDAIVVDTGSGLSYKTRITADQIVRILRAAGGYASAEASATRVGAFRSSLAVGGVDGTLRRRFRDPQLRGSVIGKTGTLTRVIALSGFVTDDHGRTLCFSIVTNGHRHRRRNQVRKEHENIVASLRDYLQAVPEGPLVPAPAAQPDRAVALDESASPADQQALDGAAQAEMSDDEYSEAPQDDASQQTG